MTALKKSSSAKAKTPKKSSSTNQIRIIGGQHRRRLISFIDADGLRPTPDRLRETIFNWLTGHITDARVLDACAGSGALGFEAISRGARHATLIEANSAQAKQLQTNAKLLGIADQCAILHADAVAAVSLMDVPFDLFFIDPPYALDLWQPLLAAVIDRQLIHTDGLIYLEADREIDSLLSSELRARFEIIKSTKVGQARAYLLGLADDE